MKKILFWLTLVCLSSKLYGQSIITSDSTKAINEFYNNAPAILDSLTKFTFVKAKNKSLNLELLQWKSNYYGLKAQTENCFVDKLNFINTNNQLSQRLIVIDTKLSKSKKENWLWRIGAFVGTALLVRNQLK